MATRIRIEFTDQIGTDWKIDILDDDYTGAIIEGRAELESVALTYEGASDETHSPLIGSLLRFSLIRTSPEIDQFVTDIPARIEGDLRAHLYRAGERIWAGVILPDTISIPLDYLHGTAEITAVDDLGLLDQIEYQDTDGSALTGSERLTDHLLRCLSYLRTEGDWEDEDEFLRVVDHLTAGTDTTYQDSAQRTYNLRTSHDTFWDVKDGVYTFRTVREVLEQIALILGARIFLAEGVWWVVPPWTYDVSSTLTYFSFRRDGQAFTGSATFDASQIVNVGPSRLEDGWTETYGPPMRSVYRSQNYGGNLYLLAQDLPSTDFATSINAPNSFDYPVGSTFTIGGTLQISLANIPTLSGPDRLVRFKLRLQVTIPGAQVGGTRYFHAPAPDPSSLWQIESVNVGTATGSESVTIFSATPTSVGEWSVSSAGTGWEIWTPPMRANDANIDVDVISFPFTFTTLPTLTDGQGLAVSAVLIGATGFVGATGGAGSGFSTALSSTYLGSASYSISDLRIAFGDGSGEGNRIRYGASVSSASKLREVLDLPESLLGDVVSTNSRGKLQVRIASEWKDTERWTSHLHGSGMPVVRLLTFDRLALRQDPLVSIEGTIHRSDDISPIHSLALGANLYLLTSSTRRLWRAASEVTAYRIAENTTGINGASNDGDIQPAQGTKLDPLPDEDGILIAGKSASAGYVASTATTTLEGVQETAAAISSGLTLTQSKLDLLLKTFTPKGDDGATTTTVKYEEDKVDGMSVVLTQNTTEISSGSGTSGLSISENSPGIFEVYLSDGITPTPSSVLVLHATTAGANKPLLGIGTDSPLAALHVVGAMRSEGVIQVYDGSTLLYTLPTTGGSAGQVLSRTGATSTEWTTPSAGGSISLLEGSNISITSDTGAGTEEIALVDSPTITSLTTTGAISVGGTTTLTGAVTALSSITALGTIATFGGISAIGNLTAAGGGVQGSWTVGGSFTANGIIVGSSGLQFSGATTSVIGPANDLPNQPTDLEIRSNGNVVVVLDYDNDEEAQSFKITDGAGATIFEVNEDGITTGLLTTAVPVVTGINASYQQGATITGSVTNAATGRQLFGAIYDSAGVEQTGNPVTISSTGVISTTAPSTIATGYELRIYAVDSGKFRSVDEVSTFEVVPSRTFTHWRIQGADASGNPSNLRFLILDLRFWDGQNGTGTKYPSANATSNTSISGLTISAGYTNSSSYAPWKATDSNLNSSGWWTISVPSAALNWIQYEFSSAITIQSVALREWQDFNYCPRAQIYGSNTGAFSGEEVLCGTIELSDSSSPAGSGPATRILNI